MQLARPVFALDPRQFGRAPLRVDARRASPPFMRGDLKLFASTFFAAFVFVSVLIA